ncbi:MAG TPA: histidine phosphatase family protein [Thermoleophilia bacterium]|nr:histidine phosphatase family protein [Thermoleophilia bacterium]
MTILLLRHGETDWNREPARCQGWAEVHLNENGRAQARDQGRALAGRGLELIVTSHLARARETAELVRAELGGEPPLIVDPRLAETHRGEWETRLFEEIVLEEPEAWQHYREHPESFRFPGGESLADQQRRVLAALRDVARDGRPALLVTHGGSIRLTRCFLDGRGVAAFHDTKTVNAVVDEIPAEGLEARIGAFLEGRRGAA